MSGLRGLQGVVRKTVSDDLQVNIWDKTHMDKIVPSLLFNLQEDRSVIADLRVHLLGVCSGRMIDDILSLPIKHVQNKCILYLVIISFNVLS